MKSLNFTVPGSFDMILDGRKTLTIRGLYIPTYRTGERIRLLDIKRKDGEKIILREAFATVADVFPVQLKDITDDVARKEGFNDAKESKQWLRETYNLKDNKNQWLFVTVFKDVSNSKRLNPWARENRRLEEFLEESTSERA